MGGLKDFGINHVVMKPRPITRLENGKVKFIKFITPWGFLRDELQGSIDLDKEQKAWLQLEDLCK